MTFRFYSTKFMQMALAVVLVTALGLVVNQTGGFTATKSVAAQTTWQRTDLRSNLYIEELISETLAKETQPGRAIGRAEFAEVMVRLNLKLSNSSVLSLQPQALIVDSQNTFVNAAYDSGMMSADAKRRFNPNGAITREQAAGVLDRILKMRQKYSKTVTGKTLMTVNGAGFRPKAALTVQETFQMVDKAVEVLKIKGTTAVTAASKGYATVQVGKYTAPVRQSTDLVVYVPTNGSADLSMSFAGVFINNPALSPKDIHMQMVTTLLSSGTFNEADGLALLKAIGSGWDETARKYHFEKEIYIKAGNITEVQPARPYVQIHSGDLLNLDVHVTH